jgi:hypothetical protein
VACFGNLARFVNNTLVNGGNRDGVHQLLLEALDEFLVSQDPNIPDRLQNGWVKVKTYSSLLVNL